MTLSSTLRWPGLVHTSALAFRALLVSILISSWALVYADSPGSYFVLPLSSTALAVDQSSQATICIPRSKSHFVSALTCLAGPTFGAVSVVRSIDLALQVGFAVITILSFVGYL